MEGSSPSSSRFPFEASSFPLIGVDSTSVSLSLAVPSFEAEEAGIGPCISPLCLSDTGEVLLHDGTCVMVYDARSDGYKRVVEIHGMDDNGVGAATVYAESLVSPNLDSTENTWY